MRFLIVYSVLFSFLFQLGNRVYVLVDFQINKEYIAENLCENKDEPESCCEGSCHLTKELNEVEEKESQSPAAPETKKEKTEEVLSITYKELFRFTRDIREIQANFKMLDIRTTAGFITAIEHPPC